MTDTIGGLRTHTAEMIDGGWKAKQNLHCAFIIFVNFNLSFIIVYVLLTIKSQIKGMFEAILKAKILVSKIHTHFHGS